MATAQHPERFIGAQLHMVGERLRGAGRQRVEQPYPGAFRGEEDRADHLVQQDSGTATAVANCFPRSATISASAATLRSAATTTPPSKPPAGDSPKAALAS